MAANRSERDEKIRRLAEALRAGKAAAEAARGEDDGGSANLDEPFLYGHGLTEVVVQRAAHEAGVSIGSRYRSSMWNGWFLGALTSGQGAMRTRMAEAAAKAIEDAEAGIAACVYYRLD